jgi:hypothetical protein
MSVEVFMLKKILIGCALIVCANFAAFANGDKPCGPFLGGQFGIAATDYKASEWILVPSGKAYHNKFGGRLYFGYAYDENLATEIGYTYYNNPSFLAKLTGAKADFSQQGVDLTARASIPFRHGLGAYLKAGGTWIYRGALNSGTTFLTRDSSNKFAFLGGGALTFSFLTHWMMDLSVTRIFKNGDLPNTDLYALGLNYKF